MSIYDWNPLVNMKDMGKSMGESKAELFEAYDQLRDLTVSGTIMAGAGTKTPNGFLFKLSHLLGGSTYMTGLGNKSINIPGTSYSDPINPGTGMVPGGQSPFGFGAMSEMSGYPKMGGSAPGGSAADIDSTEIINDSGIGADAKGSDDSGGSNLENLDVPSGTPAGGAAGLSTGTDETVGVTDEVGDAINADPTANGMNRNNVLPVAGLMGGLGTILTSISPVISPSVGLAGMAGGAILSGISGAVLQQYQQASGRVLNSADEILSAKIKNLETVVKQMGSQEDVIKKLMKDQNDDLSKALQDFAQ